MWELISTLAMTANTNKWLAGGAMLLVNLGGRYIHADLNKTHDLILSNEYFKKLIVFALFFMATRDVITAFILTLLYIFIVDGLLHGDRKYCIIPKKYINYKEQPKASDYDKAKEIVSKYENFQNMAINENNSIYVKYLANLSILNLNK
jgi:hypothetical protein